LRHSYYVKKRDKGYDEASYLIMKIWGCLADSMPYKRYCILAGINHGGTCVKLSSEELEKFKQELKNTFKADLEIKNDLGIKKIITDIKKQVKKKGLKW